MSCKMLATDKYEECYAAYCQKKDGRISTKKCRVCVVTYTLSHMLIKEMSMQ